MARGDDGVEDGTEDGGGGGRGRGGRRPREEAMAVAAAARGENLAGLRLCFGCPGWWLGPGLEGTL